MKVSIKDIRIPKNYALVCPDENYTSYQRGGRDLGIISPEYAYKEGKRVAMPSKNFAVKGTVYGVPEKIQFNRGEIKAINSNYTLVKKVGSEHKVANGQMMRKINDLKKESCRFETVNELQVGDTVKFSYMVHLTAKENNTIFDTLEGKMYFIRYDDIFMTVDTEGKPKKMINGYLLIDPDIIEIKKENGIEFTSSSSGLILPAMKTDARHRRGAKCMEGRVLLAAKPLAVYDELLGRQRGGGYFDIEDYNEIDIDVNSGDRILFDPRIAQQLDHENHQDTADHKLYLIQRKDILFMEKDNISTFDEIGMDKVNYES